MAIKYFALLTHVGAAKLANAMALGDQVEITHMSVGDGGGVLPVPDPAQTALVNERRRAPLNMLTIDPINNSQVIAEQIIPEAVGGWWIREVGLFDKDGDMVAVANCPETYKPELQEGSGRVQTIRIVFIVNSAVAVTLKIDPSVVLATRKYVDDAVIEVKGYADKLLADHVKAANPHQQYLQIENALQEVAEAGLLDKLLANLRLGAGAPPIGIPFFWPSPAMPNTVMNEWADMVFLKPNGASFSATEYPKLAKVWTGLVIPDMRGEFLRIWDDGRGVDMGRALLSGQAATSFSQFSGNYNEGSGHTIFNPDSSAGYQAGFARFKYTSPAVGDGVNFITVRPRNIAFNFLVRAK